MSPPTKLTREELLQRPSSVTPFIKLAELLAHNIERKARSRGHSIPYEDILGEVWVVWCRCRDQFKPELGFQFDTYFSKAVAHAYKDIVRRNVDYNLRNAITGPIKVNGLEGGKDGANTEPDILDLQVDELALDPEELLLRRSALDLERLRKTSPMLAAFIELVRDAPEELRAELAAIQSQAQLAKDQGFQGISRGPVALGLNMMIDMFGFDWRHRKQLTLEIQRAAENV